MVNIMASSNNKIPSNVNNEGSQETALLFQDNVTSNENVATLVADYPRRFFQSHQLDKAIRMYERIAEIEFKQYMEGRDAKGAVCDFRESEFRSAVGTSRQAASMQPTISTAKSAIELAVKFGMDYEPACFRFLTRLVQNFPQEPSLILLFAEYLDGVGAPNLALIFSTYSLLSCLNKNPLHHAALIKENIYKNVQNIAAIMQLTKGLPTVVLASLPYSGLSAIYPVLREILLVQFHYDIFASNHMSPFYHLFVDTPFPLYHYTHDSFATFKDTIALKSTKFLFLYRDPRDAFLSRVKDMVNVKNYPTLSEKEIFMKVLDDMPASLSRAWEWLQQDDTCCFKFSFEEMKRDLRTLSMRIFNFLELPVDKSLLEETIRKHSFETVTGRRRGENGDPIRTSRLLYRKGISGDWKNYFNDEIKGKFKEFCGTYVTGMGYESSDNW